MKPNSNKRSTSGEWSNGGEGSSKRVRFNSGGEEPLEELDDSAFLEKRKERRGRVTVVEYNDGEESSDDEAFNKKKEKMFVDDIPEGAVLPGAKEEDGEEEDEDMFADPEELEKQRAQKSRKAASKDKGKSNKFDRTLIEGETLKLDDLDEDDYDSEGNPKIEAFNMKEELEEGGEIDESGNFIRKLDPDRFHDSWLEGVSGRDIQAAREAHERKAKQAQAEEQQAKASAMSETDIYVELVNIVKPTEAVIEAIQRLGGGKKGGAKAKPKKKSWQKNTTEDGSAAAPESDEDINRRKTIEKLTDLCDKMMAMGHFDIYQESYEHIVRKLRRADVIPDDWEVGTPVLKPGEEAVGMLEDDPLLSTSVSWEYKWANPSEGQDPDEIFGPFSGAEMKSWSEQGFFSQGILVRMVGDSTFEPSNSVTF